MFFDNLPSKYLIFNILHVMALLDYLPLKRDLELAFAAHFLNDFPIKMLLI